MGKPARQKKPANFEQIILPKKKNTAAAAVAKKTAASLARQPSLPTPRRKKKAAELDTNSDPGGAKKKSKAEPEDEVDTAAQLRETFDEVVMPCSTLKIVTWNLNGIRAFLKKRDVWSEYLAKEDPDIICLNETKISESDIAALGDVFPGYSHVQWHCCTAKKGYSGTAIFSKAAPTAVIRGFHPATKAPKDDEGRVLTARFPGFAVISTYVPNSGLKLDRLQYRTKQWDARLQAHLDALTAECPDDPLIWCGDLNVAHRDEDVTDGKKKRNKVPGFCDAERVNFGRLVGGEGEPDEEALSTKKAQLGCPGPIEGAKYVDVWRKKRPNDEGFTYWSYRFSAKVKNKGWRLDYFVVTPSLVDRVEKVFRRPQLHGCSDHVPLGIILDMPKLAGGSKKQKSLKNFFKPAAVTK